MLCRTCNTEFQYDFQSDFNTKGSNTIICPLCLTEHYKERRNEPEENQEGLFGKDKDVRAGTAQDGRGDRRRWKEAQRARESQRLSGLNYREDEE